MMKGNLQKPPRQRTKLHAISLGMFVAPMALSSPSLAVDTDGDGTDDALDNCTLTANPNQRDSNGCNLPPHPKPCANTGRSTSQIFT